MRKLFVGAVLALFVAAPLQAQRSFAYELGLLGQYTKFADTTHLKSGVGAGIRLGIFVLPRIELEYEAQFTPTSSPTNSDIKAWNNRIEAILNVPFADKWHLLVGGGWTGTNFKNDTTHNAYDSGLNALVGVRRCVSHLFAWELEGVADFKKPSDQVQGNVSTTTLAGRVGLSWFLGGPSKNGPCGRAPAPPPPPAPPAPVVVTPAPAPAPAPPPPAPAPVAAAPAPPPPAPARPRELFTLKAVLFEFDKSTLTSGAKDTLMVAVNYLKDHGDVRVEIQGHTDSKGSDEYNMALGQRRADAVKAYLGTQGINGDRVSTRSFGESQPVADNEINGKDNPAGRALNRRVVIIELP